MKRLSPQILLSAVIHGLLICAVVFLLGYEPARTYLAGGSGGSRGKAVVWVSNVDGVGTSQIKAEPFLSSTQKNTLEAPEKKLENARGSLKSSGEGGGIGGEVGGGAGLNSGSSAGHGTDGANVLAEIWRKLDRNKFYPVSAKKQKLEGAPKVSFEITSTGKPENISIANSCGIAILDSAAIETVKRSEPLPAYSKPITVTINFAVSD